jgi:F-type H+-transporting ATPase subunit c
MLQAASRQPEAKKELTPIMWLGFALTEAVVFYGLVGAMLLVFLI